MNSKEDIKIGDKVSFVGRFGMGKWVTRVGIVDSIEKGIYKVRCKQGLHSLYFRQLQKLKDN